MAPYQHRPLDEGSIRLMQLSPDPNPEDPNRPIRCNLAHMPLLGSPSIHLFEALSYVWGSDEKTHTIFIDDCEYGVGANLHAALHHLRSPFLPRFLWIDAICINQDNHGEKGHQVQNMARIYAMANRVILWLGEAAADGSTDKALEGIRVAAAQNDMEDNIVHVDKEHDDLPEGVLNLLEHPWFERIWVLQEVAAARQVLIKCGRAELDGFPFCLGLDKFRGPLSRRQDLFSLVSSATYLIRDAIFRSRDPRQLQSNSPFSLSIGPLCGLLDMFRTRKATNPLDKVYALLGMTSDDPGEASLLADYDISWGERGDIICKLRGPPRATIVRPYQDYSTIISTTIPLSKHLAAAKDEFWFSRKGFPYDLLLVWHWSTHVPGQLPEVRFEDFVKTRLTTTKTIRNDGSGEIDTNSLPQHNLDRLTRFANAAIILDYAGNGLQLDETLSGLLGIFDSALGKFPARGKTPSDITPTGTEDMERVILRYHENDMRWLGVLLRIAAANGYDDSVRYFLSKGADVNIRNITGDTSLSLAIQGGHESTTRVLLNSGAIVHEPYPKRWGTPLLLAITLGHEGIVRNLIERGANVSEPMYDRDAKNAKGHKPLSIAMRDGHESIARLLSKRTTLPPLFNAVATGDVCVVKQLLDVSANMEGGSYPEVQWTPLIEAARRGYTEVVQVLFDYGVDINASDKMGQTALHHAAAKGHTTIVQQLLTYGAKVNCVNLQHQTPWIKAVKQGHDHIWRILLRCGADIEARCRKGRTSLHYAVEGPQGPLQIKRLVNLRASVDVGDGKGQTPLMIAARLGLWENVRVLLGAGADFRAKDDYGQTALQHAVSDHVRAVLISFGATG
ncbi:ankyrin repeat-containing domain protein [Rhypophila decipiens]|uniref:Ankyrin repeat-containing domain protein n=1 Tax=Rhypophila decipiens TaxID=261697 RepID=A0AAN7B4M3_9PEZI|nr:ankyrin repeat-containing domain protein [Rhypophila decipiens]